MTVPQGSGRPNTPCKVISMGAVSCAHVSLFEGAWIGMVLGVSLFGHCYQGMEEIIERTGYR